MKIQCNACEVAEANVLCCADEAALCWACDVKVHAANKLASKHQRVSLSTSKMPKCDICQEAVGYFFCLEDRALLCRKCDVSIHTANSFVAGHQRYLLTGVKVGLQPTEPVVSSIKDNPDSAGRAIERDLQSVSVSRADASVSWNGETSEVPSCPAVGMKGLPASKMSFSGGTTNGSNPEWPLDELLELSDINHNYGYVEHGSSKADSCKISYSPSLQAADEDFEIDEHLGQVPEIPWMVPEIPSPPTASGLFWPKSSSRNSPIERAISVPDVCLSYMHNGTLDQSDITSSKRRRQC